MKKSIEVKLDGLTITISKLPLGKYSELLKAIKELPKHANNFKDLDPTAALAILPEMIGDSLPDIIRILAIATPLTPEEIDDLGLDDVVKIVTAIIEVNNYAEVVRLAKKAMAPQPVGK